MLGAGYGPPVRAASDDRRARRVATLHNVALTGTLDRCQSVRRQHLGLDEANQYLAAMVRNLYRSPWTVSTTSFDESIVAQMNANA
ncbi:MAG: hypothetical protein R2838_14025 [Caldilineaceae bacterium]